MSRIVEKEMNQGLPFYKVVMLAGPLLVFSINPSLATDISMGQSIAQKWCASCHLVDQRKMTNDTTPSFFMMANSADYTKARLRAWLFKPHPPMPDFGLDRIQIDAVIAYIKSLKNAH